MGIVNLNMAATLESTASKSIFINVPKDGKLRVRLLPPNAENKGNLWYLTETHFNLKAEDGERGIAVACNKRHSEEPDCFLCDLAKQLADSSDPTERALGKGRNAIRANRSWYVQVLPIVKGTGDSFEAGEPKILRLPKTAADKVNTILATQQENGDALSCGLEAAQDIVITRQDTGVNITTYDALTAGRPTALEDYLPDYENKILTYDQMWEKLDLRVLTNDEQMAAVVRSYPNLDLDDFVG